MVDARAFIMRAQAKRAFAVFACMLIIYVNLYFMKEIETLTHIYVCMRSYKDTCHNIQEVMNRSTLVLFRK